MLVIESDGRTVFDGNTWDFDSSARGFKALFEKIGLQVDVEQIWLTFEEYRQQIKTELLAQGYRGNFDDLEYELFYPEFRIGMVPEAAARGFLEDQ